MGISHRIMVVMGEGNRLLWGHRLKEEGLKECGGGVSVGLIWLRIEIRHGDL